MSLFHAGLQPVIDSDGAPIAGATWNFYTTATLTPRNVFSDSACTLSLGSSQTSDAAGRFATAFVNDATPTRAILKNAGGATLLDIDPVTVSSGGGTIVSSINVSGGTTGLTATGGPVTSSGTITLAGTLVVANGGTGAADVTNARLNLSAAKSGANTDITSLQDGTTIAAGGTIAANSIGTRGLVLSAQTQGVLITLALTSAGKRVANTTGGWAIPANASVAFPTDTVIALYNNSASTQTVAITTDTLRWSGTASTGTRTVAAYGWCWLTKVAATEWSASGNLT